MAPQNNKHNKSSFPGWAAALVLRLVFLLLFQVRLLPQWIWQPVLEIDRTIWYVLSFPLLHLGNIDQFTFNFVAFIYGIIIVLIGVLVVKHIERARKRKMSFGLSFLVGLILSIPLIFLIEVSIGLSNYYSIVSD